MSLNIQFDQNTLNKLSHISSNNCPPRPLSDPPSTMHKQRLQKYLARRALHQHNLKNIKCLRTMIVNELPHDNSKKLSWHFSWNTQWPTSIVLLWASKKLAWEVSRLWKISFGKIKQFPTMHQISKFQKVWKVVWMQNFRCNHKLVAMVWCPFIHKRTRHIRPWRWWACGKKIHGGPNSRRIFQKRRQD